MRSPVRLALAVLIVASLSFASSARADDAWNDERRDAPHEGDHDVSVWSRKLAIDAQLGFGAPLGFAGVAFEATPVPWWTLGAGVGMSFSGLQLAVSSRVRYLWGHSAIAAGLGLSRGPYGAISPICCDDFGWRAHWDAAYWLDFDLFSIEHRWSSGRELRFYLGVASLLNPGDSACSGYGDANYRPPCEPHSGTLFPNATMPYLGFAYGFAFPSP